MGPPDGTRTAEDLIAELNAVDESTTIEAKTGSRIDKSVLETVSAFSNEPGLGGGYLVLGVSPAEPTLFGADYRVVGVSDPDKIQADLASQCAGTLNAPVRPRIFVETIGGRTVVVARVAEAQPSDKPIYIKSRGLPKGAFRRIGSTDQRCTEDDLMALYTSRKLESFDVSVVGDAELDDLSSEAIADYRSLRAKANPDAEELTWSDPEFLRAVRAVRRSGAELKPTVAGVLIFGASMTLRRCFPMTRVDYIRVPGREWVADPEKRFETLEIRAPLLTAVRRATSAVTDDLLRSFSLRHDELQSTRELQLPTRVVREAIVNAVMHRNYRIHGPIQIIRYANRIEIRNPGHSLKSEDTLGEPGSETRNPTIAAVLHDVNFAETKGSGIRVMRELMEEHGLMPPSFESSRANDEFVATLLLHHLLDEDDLAWARSLTSEELGREDVLALVFVRERGAIDNAAFRAMSGTDTLSASARLRRLREVELLEMRGKGSTAYYVPGRAFEGRGIVSPAATASSGPHPTPLPGGSDPDPHQPSPHAHQATPHTHQPDAGRDLADELPAELRARLPPAGKRPRREQTRLLIEDLCAWRALGAQQLAELLGDRDKRFLVRQYLTPMIEEGRLRYTIPDMIKHPEQKYTAPDDG